MDKQLLHLHPLTLEDILQQDPREKIELFPRLGYYFIVFRALDLNSAAPIADGGAVNHDLHVTNVYLTVFREGVCSVSLFLSIMLCEEGGEGTGADGRPKFHFAAITEHADRVRGRMLGSNADALPMTSGTSSPPYSLLPHPFLPSLTLRYDRRYDSPRHNGLYSRCVHTIHQFHRTGGGSARWVGVGHQG